MITKLRHITLIVWVALAALTACSEKTDAVRPPDDPEGVRIRLFSPAFTVTRVIDADNPATDQVVNNISLYLTEPGGDAIVYTYVYSGFSSVDDYKVVTLPLEPADLQTKDIYVVVNHDEATLQAITTITELEELRSPVVDKTNYLDPANGFCMYGTLSGFDFTAGTDAIVWVERTVAKVRLTLTFPENPTLSTNNTFLITGVGSYTYVTEHVGLLLNANEYFNFAAELPLTDNGSNQYVNTTYYYESGKHPFLYLYTHNNGSATAQEHVAELPLPERNVLYDLDIRVYESEATRSSAAGIIPYLHGEIMIRKYDQKGLLLDTLHSELKSILLFE